MTSNQTAWIFSHLKELTDEYLECIPMSDDNWERMIAQVKELGRKSRDNPLMIKLLIDIIHFFEEESKNGTNQDD